MKIRFWIVCISCCILLVNHHAYAEMSEADVIKHEAKRVKDASSGVVSLVALGDSITKGVGDSSGMGGYPGFLKELLIKESYVHKVTMNNFGKRGLRSSQLLELVKQNEIIHSLKNADIVVATIGGNDIMKVVRDNYFELTIPMFDKQQQNYEKNIGEILAAIRSENPFCIIVIIGLYNPFSVWFDNLEEINIIMRKWDEVSKQIALSHKQTLFVEIGDLFEKNTKALLNNDYFHPNTLGYQLIAERVYDSLKQRYQQFQRSF
ncbi:SGNH/GDSL hydrolase family protein [Cytobacillus sp. IB215665]|uniref:SGNH/GDSL hydrolase family protein n=1 Tax=Cytobacillus sp. IB215665 TaxID=3097357 RepID=UPI002A0F5607|nr:SGNH/GDSL hydrolase family protein [Cytobacillus sp. IB215665]MDX8366232.1 SGNH/GDSL hydrolase family protein [Cytobacillus sp. IB215665]